MSRRRRQPAAFEITQRDVIVLCLAVVIAALIFIAAAVALHMTGVRDGVL